MLASVIVQYEPCEVTNVELDINRTREVGKPLASTLWGSDHNKESYVKFKTLDLSHPVFMTSMISRWVDKGLQWQLKIDNPDTGRFRCYTKADKKGLSENNTSDINLKVHLQLERGQNCWAAWELPHLTILTQNSPTPRTFSH